MRRSRCIFALLQAGFISFSIPVQSQSFERPIKNKVIVILSENAEATPHKISQLIRFRNARASDRGAKRIASINYLYPHFCALARNSKNTPQAAHLKLLDQGLRDIPKISNNRLDAIKEYLRKPESGFCNQYVVSGRATNSKSLAESLMQLTIEGAKIRELLPVFKYRIARAEVAKLATPRRRPNYVAGVISSPLLNQKFFGMRRLNRREISGDSIDNEGNGYVDDLYGINSSEPEFQSNGDLNTGFVTLAVATDKGKDIEYTTIDLARVILYAIHLGAENAYLPISHSDKVLAKLLAVGRRVGFIVISDRKAFEDSFLTSNNPSQNPAPTKVPVNFGTPSAEEGVGCVYTGRGCCSGVEVIQDRCILTAAHCVDDPGASLAYSKEGIISFNSCGVRGLRVEKMPPLRAPLGGPVDVVVTDLAVMYTGKYVSKLLPNQSGRCIDPLIYSWNPKTLAAPAVNDIVKIVGYSSQDVQRPGVNPNDYHMREGKFTINQIIPVSSTIERYEKLRFKANGGERLNNGDSGAPLLYAGKIVGLQTHGISNAANTPFPEGQGPGMALHQREWVAAQVRKICRLVGRMKVTVVASDQLRVPGFIIKMISEDSWDEQLSGTETCEGQSCERRFMNLKVAITPPAGWKFKEWGPDNIANFPPCLCDPDVEQCEVRLTTRSDVENLEDPFEQGIVRSNCEAIYEQVTAVPTATFTQSSTPVSRPSITNTPVIPTPTVTGTPRSTPVVTPTPAATATTTATVTPTPPIMCAPLPWGTPSVCAGRCVDTQTDPFNCGSCGVVCPQDSKCMAGTCSPRLTPTPVCDQEPGSMFCAGRCVNTRSDANNCGSCGRVCPLSSICMAGDCSATPQPTATSLIRFIR